MRTAGMVPLALVLGLGVAGCSNGNGLTGNIGDWVDTATGLIPDTKKPLPGERKAVFPEGVPGVPQGVPPELVKGYQSSPETTGTTPLPNQAAPEKPPVQANAKPAPQSISPAEKSERAKAAESEKPKPKKKVAAKHPAQTAQSPAQPQPAQKPNTQAPWPGTAPAQTGTAPWPAPQQARPTAQWPSQSPQQSQSTAAWPDPRQTQQPAQ